VAKADDLLHAAVRNNATWCSLVCATHGSAGSFDGAAWVNAAPAPPLYPNLVTLAPDQHGEQLAAIARLDQARLPIGWAVKDSYAELDLALLGFTRLLEGTWLGLAAGEAIAAGSSDLAWRRIAGHGELAAWERAWAAPAQPDRVFRPALLADARLAVFAGYRVGQVVAGAIACRSDGALGLSNVFGPPDEVAAALPGCVCLARDFAPAEAVVGWESAATSAIFAAAGFRSLGPLVVWQRR
jgi:hypothetical protein